MNEVSEAIALTIAVIGTHCAPLVAGSNTSVTIKADEGGFTIEIVAEDE